MKKLVLSLLVVIGCYLTQDVSAMSGQNNNNENCQENQNMEIDLGFDDERSVTPPPTRPIAPPNIKACYRHAKRLAHDDQGRTMGYIGFYQQ